LVKLVAKIDGVPLYEDKYMEDNKILKGTKGNFLDYTFMIANPKTAQIIYQAFIKRDRKEKLIRLSKYI